MTARPGSTLSASPIALEERFGAANYLPLPVVLTRGEGVYLWDDDGRRYLDGTSSLWHAHIGHGREDMAEAGLSQGDLVDVTSHFEGEQRSAPHWMVVPYDIPRRCTATYFPEGNVLVPVRSVAARSNTPTSKSVII